MLEFEEPEGRLYEYLEGILLRGISKFGRGLPREIAIYDLRKIGEWEDVSDAPTPRPTSSEAGEEEDDEIGDGEEGEVSGIRHVKKYDFVVAEFAVDPGMDLLVVTEVR
jgi:hypothetical protein